MASRLSYRDFSHPLHKETIKAHNTNTLRLVRTVAEFAQKISIAHEQFASQVQNVVDVFKKRNLELKKDRGPVEIYEDKKGLRRPIEWQSTLSSVWDALLQETQYDAQAHADTANLLLKNVYSPLLEIASYKKSQSKKLYAFRESFESILSSGDEAVQKCQKTYVDAYQSYRSNMNTRDSLKHLEAYHTAHNHYVLTIKASNIHHQEYHQTALPYLLEELEEIHIDLANTLNGAIESHSLLLLTKASEQSKQYDSILKLCKQVNPVNDVHNFLMTLSADKVEKYEPISTAFAPPCDPTIPGSELGTLKQNVVFERHTEASLAARRLELQREAGELTSYLKQNQDVTQSLMNICQRNIANHQYAKVYETQEDLCRKRNEIRMAHLQLAAIRSQIDLLSQKQNGSMESDSKESVNKTNKGSIRGMWRKAVKSLNQKKEGEHKDKKDKESEKSEKDSEKRRMNSSSNFYTPSVAAFESRSDENRSIDSKLSSQSSIKRSLLKRKDSKEQPTPPEDDEEQQGPAEIDPVYSLLKCAADLPRHGKIHGHGHACCMRAAENLTVRSISRSSSPSSGRSAKIRRVQFHIESRKSQSLETPYHHSHHHQRLAGKIQGVHERSRSYTSIATYAGAMTGEHGGEGQIQPRRLSLKVSPSLPDRLPDQTTKDAAEKLEDSEETGLPDPPVPNTTFKGDVTPNMTKDVGVGIDKGTFKNKSETKAVTCSKSHRREAFQQQRSYSCGDITPSGDEKSEDLVIDSAAQILRDAVANRGKGLKEKGMRRGVEESSHKSSTERRKGWIQQKQKSKSFDFTWRSGMWSPVEGRKHFIVVPEKKKQPNTVKLKPPSMFELESGSSYESNDVTIFRPKKTPQVPGLAQREDIKVGGIKGSESDVCADLEVEQLTQGRDLNSEVPNMPLSEEAIRQLQEKRRTMMVENKSHSFDSSMEEAQEQEGQVQKMPKTGGSPSKIETPRESRRPGLSVRDKRLRLLQQRKSRSLDAYDPNEHRVKLDSQGPWSKPDPEALRRRASASPATRRGSSSDPSGLKSQTCITSSSRGSPSRGSPGGQMSRRKAFAEQKSFSYEVTRQPFAQSRPNGEPQDKQEKARSRSKGRILPQLPILEHQLEEHIQKVISGTAQATDTKPSLSGHDASTANGQTKSPKTPETCQKIVEKPKSTDRRKLFSEQKSFSYEVNQYSSSVSQQTNTVNKKSGSEGMINSSTKVRDYWEEKELKNLHDLQLQQLHREFQSCKPGVKVPYDQPGEFYGSLSSAQQTRYGTGPQLVTIATQTELEPEKEGQQSIIMEKNSSNDRRKVFGQQKSFSYEVTTRHNKPQLVPTDKFLQGGLPEHRLSPSSPRSPRSPRSPLEQTDKSVYSKHHEKRRSTGSPHSPRSPRSPHEGGDRIYEGESEHRRPSYTGSPHSPHSPHFQSEQHFDLPIEARRSSQASSPKIEEHRRPSAGEDRRILTTKLALKMPPEKHHKSKSTSPREATSDSRHMIPPGSPRELISRDHIVLEMSGDIICVPVISSPREGDIGGEQYRYPQAGSPRQRDFPAEPRRRAHSGSKKEWINPDERSVTHATSPRDGERRMSQNTSPREKDPRRVSQSSPRESDQRRMSQSSPRESDQRRLSPSGSPRDSEQRKLSQSASPRYSERRKSQSGKEVDSRSHTMSQSTQWESEPRRMSQSGRERDAEQRRASASRDPEQRRMSQGVREREERRSSQSASDGRRPSQSAGEGRRLSQTGGERGRSSQPTGEGRRPSQSTGEVRRPSQSAGEGRRPSQSSREERRLSRSDVPTSKRRTSRDNLALDMESTNRRSSRSDSRSPHDILPEQKNSANARISQDERDDRPRTRRTSGPRSPHAEQLRNSHDKVGDRRSSSGSPRSPNTPHDGGRGYDGRGDYGQRLSQSPHRSRDRTPESGEKRWAAGDRRNGSRSPSETRKSGGIQSRRKMFSEQKSFSYDSGTNYHPHPAVARVEEIERTERRAGKESSYERRGPLSLRDKRLRMMESKKSSSLDELLFAQHMAEGHHESDMNDASVRHPHPEPLRTKDTMRVDTRPSARDLAPNANKIKLMMLHSMKAIAQENGHNGHGTKSSEGVRDLKPVLTKEGSIEVIPIQMQSIDPNRKDVLGQIMQERINLEMQKANLDPTKVSMADVAILLQRALHDRPERSRISEFDGTPRSKLRGPQPRVQSPLTISEDGQYNGHYDVTPSGLSVRYDHYHQGKMSNSERVRAEFGKSRRQTEPDVHRPNREILFTPRLSLQVQPMPLPPDAPHSPPQKRRGPKLNLRMKSFSMDTPDTPKIKTIDESSKSKSGSFSKMQGSCFGNESPSTSSRRESRESSPAQRNKDVERVSSHLASPAHSPVRDEEGPTDSPPRPRQKKLNMRMKSFSVDTPEHPCPPPTIDENSKQKSSSFTNASTCFGAPTSPSGNTFVPSQRRSKFSLRSSSVDIEESCQETHFSRSNHSPSPRSEHSPKSQGKPYSGFYVVLFSFKPREKGDLDLKAGDKVCVLDTTDPDWWRGKCGSKIGYFPSSYVCRLLSGEKAMQVVSGLEVSKDATSGVKLLKEQIVIKLGEEDEDGMVMIRTSDNVCIPCPTKYLAEV